MSEAKGDDSWSIVPTKVALSTVNPIRNVVDKIVKPVNHPAPLIDLALGDPSVFGNLPPTKEVLEATIATISSQKFNGYTHSAGTPAARAAVAKRYSNDVTTLSADDVIITCGASQAILLSMQILCNPGDKILIPRPGFSLYETVAGHLGAEAVTYSLVPERSWEADVDQLEKLVDAKTRAILINNPGNPTGSNYSRQHIENLIAFAKKHKLPIIADEIYADMVFTGEKFTAFADVAGDVPVFTIGGIAKQYLVPGWRVGWLTITDRAQRLKALRGPLISLTQVVLGSTTVVQAALPAIFDTVPRSYYEGLNATLEKQALYVYEACKALKGLQPVKPQGAMYVMVGINPEDFEDIKDDTEFASKLLTEQNVFVLPGACFKANNFFRIVYCAPEEKLKEFTARLAVFCDAHKKKA